jgi:N-acetylglucosaminylphosphatidylinositol deacetylase
MIGGNHPPMNYVDLLLYVLTFSKVSLVLLNVGFFLIVIFYRKVTTQSEQIETFLGKTKKILYIVAHPDDEAMFFVPTIGNFKRESHLLCMSNGNFDEIGKVREKEMHRSCDFLGIKELTIIDDPNLQDGPNNFWNRDLLKKYVSEYIEKHQIDTAVTFDDLGISCHPNHIAVFEAVNEISKLNKTLQCWKLVTCALVRKYIGIVDFAVWLFMDPPDDDNRITIFTSRLAHTYDTMCHHASQLVCSESCRSCSPDIPM